MGKILLVTLDFYPAVGGISRYWMSLGRFFSSDELVVLAPPLPAGAYEMHAPYTIYRRPFLSRRIYPQWTLLIFTIISIARRERITQIIAGQLLPVGTAVWIASMVLRVPFLVSVHGMDVAILLRQWRKRLLATLILRHCRVIANSVYTSSLVAQFGVEKTRIACVYPCPNITPECIQKIQFPLFPKRFHPILLTVGRLVARKGHAHVLETITHLLPLYPHLLYAIVGDGPERLALESLVSRLGVSKHVVFLGALDDTKTAWWYQHCTVFVMTPTSRAGDVEGFGIVYLEAQSFGRPVIGVRTGGVAEAVDDGTTGILVQPSDTSSDCADHLRSLLDDPLRAAQLGAAGRERIRTLFQWSVQAQKLMSFLENHSERRII